MKSLRKEVSLFRLASALVSENGMLKLTRKGRYLWLIMMREFFTGVNNFRDACRTDAGSLNVSVEPSGAAEVVVGE